MKKLKPFLQWVGGKTKLLQKIERQFPIDIRFRDIYIEPFLGGGSVLLFILENYQNFDKIIANDLNKNIIDCYECVKSNFEKLLNELHIIKKEYNTLIGDHEKQKELFLRVRSEFNNFVRTEINGGMLSEENIVRKSAILMFMNKVGFNGLYRENSKGEYNVPFGSEARHNKFVIDEENLRNLNESFQKVIFISTDFFYTLDYLNSKDIKNLSNRVFVYLDPPYIKNSNSNFTKYTSQDFNKEKNNSLKTFCEKLTEIKVPFVLSNSYGEEIREMFKDNSKYTLNTLETLYNIGLNTSKQRKNKENARKKSIEVLVSNKVV